MRGRRRPGLRLLQYCTNMATLLMTSIRGHFLPDDSDGSRSNQVQVVFNQISDPDTSRADRQFARFWKFDVSEIHVKVWLPQQCRCLY